MGTGALSHDGASGQGTCPHVPPLSASPCLQELPPGAALIVLYLFELVLGCAAERTYKIFGYVFPQRSGIDSLVGKPCSFVILPAADCAYIFFHVVPLSPAVFADLFFRQAARRSPHFRSSNQDRMSISAAGNLLPASPFYGDIIQARARFVNSIIAVFHTTLLSP